MNRRTIRTRTSAGTERDGIRPPGRSAFTLIEMLAVLGIMALMLLVAAPVFRDIGRGAGLRGAVLNIRSSVAFARQRAITERKKTVFLYENESNAAGRKTGRYAVVRDDPSGAGPRIPLTETNYLTEGTYFETGGEVTYKYDGSCEGGAVPIKIVIREDRVGSTALTATNTIMPLTGTIRTSAWVED